MRMPRPKVFQDMDLKIRAERLKGTKTYMKTQSSEIFNNQILKGEEYRLTRDFFSQPTLTVAQALLGKIIVFANHKIQITETEAYTTRIRD